MAYLKNIEHVCSEPGCTKRARVQLVDRWNGERGVYCTPHGKRALDYQNRTERGNAAQ